MKIRSLYSRWLKESEIARFGPFITRTTWKKKSYIAWFVCNSSSYGSIGYGLIRFVARRIGYSTDIYQHIYQLCRSRLCVFFSLLFLAGCAIVSSGFASQWREEKKSDNLYNCVYIHAKSAQRILFARTERDREKVCVKNQFRAAYTVATQIISCCIRTFQLGFNRLDYHFTESRAKTLLFFFATSLL